MGEEGGKAQRFVLLGTDYVYPRTTNKILRAFLKSKGIADADIMEEYTHRLVIATIKPLFPISRNSLQVKRLR
jgi:hypothetical protein